MKHLYTRLYEPKTPDEALVLDFFRVIRHVRKWTTIPSEEHMLSIGQLQALMSIKLGHATMKDIAEELCVAFPTATIMVDRLVQGGYLVREHDEEDRRVIHMRLTEKGEELLETSFHQKMESLREILEQLPDNEKADFDRIMKILINLFEKEEQLFSTH